MMPTNSAAEFQLVWNPNLQAASKLIIKTWEHPCWKYDVELLQLHINRPTGDPSLTVGHLNLQGELVSYLAHMPFVVEYCGQILRAVFLSFLTVGNEYQGKGLSGTMQKASIERAKAEGYDLFLAMSEVGAVANPSIERALAKAGHPTTTVKSLGYLAARIDFLRPLLPANASPRTRRAARADLPALGAISRMIGAGVDLRKIIAADDVEFVFLTRPRTRTYVYEKEGRIVGLVNVLLLAVLDKAESLNVYFENVYFGEMAADDQLGFIGDCLADLSSTGFQLALVPDIGYVGMESFRRLRFRAAPRQLYLYAAPLKAGVFPQGPPLVQSIYLDVY